MIDLFSFFFFPGRPSDLLSSDRQIPIIRLVLVQTAAPRGIADNNSRHLLLDRRDYQETKGREEQEIKEMGWGKNTTPLLVSEAISHPAFKNTGLNQPSADPGLF